MPPEQEQLKIHCTTGSAAQNESPDSHVKLIQVHVHTLAILPRVSRRSGHKNYSIIIIIAVDYSVVKFKESPLAMHTH